MHGRGHKPRSEGGERREGNGFCPPASRMTSPPKTLALAQCFWTSGVQDSKRINLYFSSHQFGGNLL